MISDIQRSTKYELMDQQLLLNQDSLVVADSLWRPDENVREGTVSLCFVKNTSIISFF